MYNFIVNPEVSFGKGLRIWKAITRYMDSHNIGYEVLLTEGIGDARTAVRRPTDSRSEPRYIIAVSGKETMNGVLGGMSLHGLLGLGHISADSGSGLAGSLRMPGCTIECLRKRLAPQYFTTIDYGVLTYGNQEVSHRRLLVSAGIGFNAAVCQDTLSSRRHQRLNRFGMGKLSYILIDIHQFFKCKSGKGYILLDRIEEVEFSNILFVSYHIQPSEGDGFLFVPRADGSDGELNVCVVGHSTRIRLIPALLSTLIGRWRPKGTRTYECRRVSIRTEAALPVHADDEGCGFQTDIRASYIAREVRTMIWRRQ